MKTVLQMEIARASLQILWPLWNPYEALLTLTVTCCSLMMSHLRSSNSGIISTAVGRRCRGGSNKELVVKN